MKGFVRMGKKKAKVEAFVLDCLEYKP